VVIDLGSAALLRVIPDARGRWLVAADHLVLAQDEVTHLFVVLGATVVREAVHEVFHGDFVPSTSTEKLLAENVFFVEEDDHGSVQEARVVPDRFEQLRDQPRVTFWTIMEIC